MIKYHFICFRRCYIAFAAEIMQVMFSNKHYKTKEEMNFLCIFTSLAPLLELCYVARNDTLGVLCQSKTKHWCAAILPRC